MIHDIRCSGLVAIRTAQRLVVYGYSGSESNRGPVDLTSEFREFSTDGFLLDLANCQSVIATAGFTLISEAMYLQKPYRVFSMHGQFEQNRNALCLERLGVGMEGERPDCETVAELFLRLPALASTY